jgi:2-dehydro-3-deoxyglucarate aldolase/4-hydroxy-2-oxoheptanedioate aldolase
MKPNAIKTKLRDGTPTFGTFVFEFATTGIARLSAAAGAEFIIFDMEHTGWSIETIRMLLATSCAADIVPMVRVPATEYHFLARALDLGAMGLMVPMVDSAEQARKIVHCAKYPPAGRRGAAFGVGHDNYTGGDWAPKMRSADAETLLIAQIETERGLENLDAIAAVEGIDVLWIGQYDLTNFLGIPGQGDHPKYLDAVRRVLDAVRRHGKAAGFLAMDVEQGRALLAQGFRMLAYGGDLWIYQRALRDGIAALREAASR